MKNFQSDPSATISPIDGTVLKKASNFSIPIPLLANFQKDWQKYGQAKLTLSLAPLTSDTDKSDNATDDILGEVSILVSLQALRRAPNGIIQSKVEATCRKKKDSALSLHPLTLNVIFTIELLKGEYVTINVSLEPRSIIENKMPLAMKICTPMPQTFSTCKKEEKSIDKKTTYYVNPNERIEVFTPGPSIAITTRTSDSPIAGLDLGWLNGGWVDLPLIREFRLQDPIVSMLPLDVGRSAVMEGAKMTREIGAEFFIVEGNDKLETIADIDTDKIKNATQNPPFQANPLGPTNNDSSSDPLVFILTVCNYGVDHTGSILFEQGFGIEATSSLPQSSTNIGMNESQRGRVNFIGDLTDSINRSQTKIRGRLNGRSPLPLGAFSSPMHRRRISLLPNSQSPIQLLQMTIEGNEGFRRTMVCLLLSLNNSKGSLNRIPLIFTLSLL